MRGNLFLKTLHLITQQQYVYPRDFAQNPFSLANHLRMYALGKGMVEFLQTWGILLIYSQLQVEKFIMGLLN